MKFAFECPNCKDVATIGDFEGVGADPGLAGQECIGRHLGALTANYIGRGCNRVAYGLFRGPWEIVVQGDDGPRSVWGFPLAGSPKAS